jgi:hypothetical protein
LMAGSAPRGMTSEGSRHVPGAAYPRRRSPTPRSWAGLRHSGDSQGLHLSLVVPEGPGLSGTGRTGGRCAGESTPPTRQQGGGKGRRDTGKRGRRDTGSLQPMTSLRLIITTQGIFTAPITKADVSRGSALSAPTSDLDSHGDARRAHRARECAGHARRRRGQRGTGRPRSRHDGTF